MTPTTPLHHDATEDKEESQWFFKERKKYTDWWRGEAEGEAMWQKTGRRKLTGRRTGKYYKGDKINVNIELKLKKGREVVIWMEWKVLEKWRRGREREGERGMGIESIREEDTYMREGKLCGRGGEGGREEEEEGKMGLNYHKQTNRYDRHLRSSSLRDHNTRPTPSSLELPPSLLASSHQATHPSPYSSSPPSTSLYSLPIPFPVIPTTQLDTRYP